jgi:hypothetical protein
MPATRNDAIALWACTDCLMLFANGETPPELGEDETAAWFAEIDRRTDGYHVAVGGAHEDGCPNLAPDGSWDGSTDCDCETEEFTWRSCGTCGSHLGGSRHAVTLFTH